MGVLETGVTKEGLLKLEWKSEGGFLPSYPCPYEPVLLENDMKEPDGEDGMALTATKDMAENSMVV